MIRYGLIYLVAETFIRSTVLQLLCYATASCTWCASPFQLWYGQRPWQLQVSTDTAAILREAAQRVYLRASLFLYLAAGSIKYNLLQAMQVRIRTKPKLGTVTHCALRLLEPDALVA